MTDPHRAWERAVGCAICTLFTYSIICWKIYRFFWEGGYFLLGDLPRGEDSAGECPEEIIRRERKGSIAALKLKAKNIILYMRGGASSSSTLPLYTKV